MRMVDAKVEKICVYVCLLAFLGSIAYAVYLASASEHIQRKFCPGGVHVNISEVNLVEEMNKFTEKINASEGLQKRIKKLAHRLANHFKIENRTIKIKDNVSQ